ELSMVLSPIGSKVLPSLSEPRPAVKSGNPLNSGLVAAVGGGEGRKARSWGVAKEWRLHLAGPRCAVHSGGSAACGSVALPLAPKRLYCGLPVQPRISMAPEGQAGVGSS